MTTTIRTWEQKNRIQINEVDHDYDAHAFEITFKGKHIVTIYADSPEQTEDMRASLDAGEDVRDWHDGFGNHIGTLIFYTMSPYSMGDE